MFIFSLFAMDYKIVIGILSVFLYKFCDGDVYTHIWAAHIEGGEELVKSLTETHGFTYLGKIFDDHYQLAHRGVAKRSTFPGIVHEDKLKQEPQVKWLEQQKVLRRVKRNSDANSLTFNDPKWPEMWYLNRGRGIDMNVRAAWLEGYKGQGVVVTVLDDGIERNHPDLENNYDPEASYDVNSNDPDPMPRYDYTNENRHGTRCAGVVAAEADNGVCGVGVAFEASIGGIRMLGGDVTDVVEAQSISYKPQHIDIYTVAWGPSDDGQTLDGPATLMQHALVDGVEQGRGGKGSIFVWSSGNGGRSRDWCGCDGYATSIYTLSIGSASESGDSPWYSEACPSILAVTYSSGQHREGQLITTDLRKSCTEEHTGTSASSSLAAGVCALALSANPSLTWRDLQHIVVLTSRSENLKATDWVRNGAGKKVSHSFGFGLMDATAMVKLAKEWTTVPEQHKCELHPEISQYPRTIGPNKLSSSLQSDGCHGTQDEVVYLEHVQVMFTLSTLRRGQIYINLTSPQGTTSTLLSKRPRDNSPDGFINWPFMTTHSWGETALGTWTLEVKNDDANFPGAKLESWYLILYGTSTNPWQGQSQLPSPEPDSSTTDSMTSSSTGIEETTDVKESDEHENNVSWNGTLVLGVLVVVQISVVLTMLFAM